jgi:hypothetical protein
MDSISFCSLKVLTQELDIAISAYNFHVPCVFSDPSSLFKTEMCKKSVVFKRMFFFFFTHNRGKIIEHLLFRKLIEASALTEKLIPTIPDTLCCNVAT